jgi:hypothetical protein
MGLLKKITKPISKVLDKIVPNEVKPFLPYLAAVAPYMLPPGAGGIFGSIGIQNPMLQRALLTGTLNLGSQLAQEGSEGDFSGISALLAAGQGALTAPGASQSLEALRPTVGAEGQLTGLQSLGSKSISLLQRGSEGLQNIMEAGKADPFSMAGLKAASIPITQGSADLAMATARKALKDYESELAAFNEQAGATTEASDLARRNAIISSMTAAAFDQDTIDDTLAQLGLRNGGRVGAMNGGIMTAKRGLVNAPGGYAGEEGFGGIEKAVESVEKKPKTFLVDKLKVTVNPGESQEKAMLNAMFNDVDDVMPQDRKEEFYRLLIPKLKNTGEISDNEYEMLMQEVFSKAKGGIISLNMGGSVLPKGIEMDLRGGGFIPMGSMEKADDVPARVSKNEFVMTADAVRAAGGGSINKGAQRMYQLMNNLEARV